MTDGSWRTQMRTLTKLLALVAPLALAAPAAAQGRDNKIPEGHRPPPGMCRVWIDGVPAGQQPAPTDCPTAVRNKPSNGTVIFGEPERKPVRKLPLNGWTRGDEKSEPPKVEPKTDAPKVEPKQGSKGAPKVDPRRRRPDDGR
jgi:hypothetical protein